MATLLAVYKVTMLTVAVGCILYVAHNVFHDMRHGIDTSDSRD